VGGAVAGAELAAVPAVIFPGAIAWIVVGAWYLYRCIRGWLRFNDSSPSHEHPIPNCIFCKIAEGKIPRRRSTRTTRSSPSTTSIRGRRCISC
jgi:hypothetical protein